MSILPIQTHHKYVSWEVSGARQVPHLIGSCWFLCRGHILEAGMGNRLRHQLNPLPRPQGMQPELEESNVGYEHSRGHFC